MRPTVLIVDEDVAFRQILRRRLSAAVTIVGEASDGEQAVRLAVELEPDVVLMAISLPVVDGMAATRWIKSERPETRIILMTAHEEEAFLSATGKSGADAFLPKKDARLGALTIVRSAARGFTGGWDGRERRRPTSERSDWDQMERRGRGAPLRPPDTI